MFQQHDEYRFKKIIDEFILSSSDNESIKSFLRNVEFEASKLVKFWAFDNCDEITLFSKMVIVNIVKIVKFNFINLIF